MKATIKGDSRKYLKDNLPSVQDQLDALFEGGSVAQEMKNKVKIVKDKVKKAK